MSSLKHAGQVEAQQRVLIKWVQEQFALSIYSAPTKMESQAKFCSPQNFSGASLQNSVLAFS